MWNPSDKAKMRTKSEGTVQSLIKSLQDSRHGLAKKFAGKTDVDRSLSSPVAVPESVDDVTPEDKRKALSDVWISNYEVPDPDWKPELADTIS